MTTNVGNVTVTVKLDDSLRERAIAVLEKSKRPHVNCVMTPCTCGADQLNAEADSMIAELKKEPVKSSGIQYL